MEKEKKSRCPGAVDLFAKYKKLSEAEKRAFFNKVFASALHGSNQDLKDDVKKDFAAIWKKIEAFQAEANKDEIFDKYKDVDIDELKKAIAFKKKQAKTK